MNTRLGPWFVYVLIILGLVRGTNLAQAQNDLFFEKIVLTDEYYCDGVAAGDINRDGHCDIVAGPFWYAGPDWREFHPIYEPIALSPEASPSNSMFSFVYDFDGDNWLDVLVLGRVHRHQAFWYRNPGEERSLEQSSLTDVQSETYWEKHFVFERIRGESPQLVDIDGNGLPQLICHWDGRWGSVEPVESNPTEPWQFKPIGAAEDWNEFYHGEGVGDLNQDGRLDLILKHGWYLQPHQNEGDWEFYRQPFTNERGGAQMFVYDVDDDGDQDVLSSVDAHGWGLAWYEQRQVGDDRRFHEHLVMGSRDQEHLFGVAFSQPHALALADIDGDTLPDLIAGKRRWAHGPSGDIEPSASPVIYWFQLTRTDDEVSLVPHLVDDESGVGVQIQAMDVNNDGRCDILSASKLGTFVFLNRSSDE